MVFVTHTYDLCVCRSPQGRHETEGSHLTGKSAAHPGARLSQCSTNGGSHEVSDVNMKERIQKAWCEHVKWV